MDWRAVIGAAATGATGVFAPAVAPIVIPALNAALQKNPEDDLERWMKDIEALAKNGRIQTDKGRALVMKGKIRYDIYQRRGEIPPKEEVNWLLETLVMAYYGVEDVDALGGPE